MPKMSNFRSPAFVAIGRLAVYSIAILLIALFATTAFARDPASLGDLSIPATRLPDWHDLDYLPLDTSAWIHVNVPCNGGDQNALRNAYSSASAFTVLILPANCTYRFDRQFSVYKSSVVLRGASRTTSILEFSDRDADMVKMMIETFPANAPFGGARDWTAGYTTGTTVLTLLNTGGLSIGGWVRMTANPEADWHQNAENRYTAKVTCIATAGGAECAGLAANQIKIDHPLPSPFHQGAQILEYVTGTFIHNAGIENVRFQHVTPNTVQKYRQYVKIEDCFECWITDSVFGNGGNRHIGTDDVVRTVIRGNDFGSNQCYDDGETCPWNKGAIYMSHGNADLLFENNSLRESPSGPLAQGGSSNVIAYNYMTSSDAVTCERHVFLHGQGVTSTLTEGNDVDCAMQWDSFRDGQGYNNTFYRNRLRGERGEFGYQRGRLGGEDTGSHIHRFITVIGNHVNELMGGPQTAGRAIDESVNATHHHQDTWVSYNIARNEIVMESSGQQVRTTAHENYERSSPNPSWSTFAFPASFYRTGTPSWWCEESGEFPNVGAPSDTAGSYSRLPAQIRLEGGTCTTSDGTVNNPVRPDPPVLY